MNRSGAPVDDFALANSSLPAALLGVRHQPVGSGAMARWGSTAPAAFASASKVFWQIQPRYADAVVSHAIVNIEATRQNQVIPRSIAVGKTTLGTMPSLSFGTSGAKTGSGER